MNIKFITLTNDGYLDFTLNCLKSLEKINFKGNLHCYCIGEKCYNVLKDKKYIVSKIDSDLNKLMIFGNKDFINITFLKFQIIYENLKKYKYVCFTDGDIIFKNNRFLKLCYLFLGDNELFIQNDSVENKKNNLCSGLCLLNLIRIHSIYLIQKILIILIKIYI